MILHLSHQRDDRGDQATYPDCQWLFSLRYLNELMQRAILAAIHDTIAVADEDNSKNVFSQVMYIAFQCCNYDCSLWAGRRHACWIKELHYFSHGTTCQHDLKEIKLFKGAFSIQRRHCCFNAMLDDVLGTHPAYAEMSVLGHRFHRVAFEYCRNEVIHHGITHNSFLRRSSGRPPESERGDGNDFLGQVSPSIQRHGIFMLSSGTFSPFETPIKVDIMYGRYNPGKI